MAGLLLGLHVSKKSKFSKKDFPDISKTIEFEMQHLGLNSAQIFVAGPQSMAPNRMDYQEVKNVCADIDLTVHSAYPSVGIWKVSNESKNTTESKRKLGVIKLQLEICEKIGAWGLVLHISKYYAEEIAETMKLLKPYAKKTGVKIVLEMVASKADDKTYETPEKLNNLITRVGPNESWWGLCIDTAHVWAAGCDEVRGYDSMKSWLDRIVFKKKICMFHLNGIYTACGSGKDKHAIAFSSADQIWGGIAPSKSGVRAIVEFSIKNGIPIVCEINVIDCKATVESLETIKKIALEV